MTDLGGGFYVSRVDSDDYEPDDEAGGLAHVMFEDGEAAAGLWKPDPDPAVDYAGLELPARETVVVLKGSVRIEVEDGPTLDLGVGDMASMPAGAVTTWHPSPDFEEVWVYH
ncbi:MAG TPA: cupin domain-containing protein [Gaiellaceae bacterium]|nr:cupin domain-containing protein [Gaiellaceae bacterium]